MSFFRMPSHSGYYAPSEFQMPAPPTPHLQDRLSDENILERLERISVQRDMIPSSWGLGMVLSMMGNRLGAMDPAQALPHVDEYMDCIDRLDRQDILSFQGIYPLVDAPRRERYYRLLEAKLDNGSFQVQPVPDNQIGRICRIFFTQFANLPPCGFDNDINAGLHERREIACTYWPGEDDMAKLAVMLRSTIDQAKETAEED